MTHLLRTAPPPPPIRKGYVQAYEAIYGFTATKREELSFEEGDLLYVLNQSDPHWWMAQLGHKQGLIPSNYVSSSLEKVPIVEAAARGNVELMSECLKMGISVNSLNKIGSSPLHASAQGGHIECVRLLLTVEKLEINLQNKMGDTPLHCASFRGHLEVIEMLLSHGARSDIPNRENLLAKSLAKNGSVVSIFDQFETKNKRSSNFSADDYGVESEDSD